MSSNPLLREPAGGSAFTTMIAPIFSLSSWLPRRRDEHPPFAEAVSERAIEAVAFRLIDEIQFLTKLGSRNRAPLS